MVQNFRDSFWGPNGFEELKKYMRFGNDFCKELSNILAERTDLEVTYSKSLSKVGLKLQKLSKEFIG
jgi:nostrin